MKANVLHDAFTNILLHDENIDAHEAALRAEREATKLGELAAAENTQIHAELEEKALIVEEQELEISRNC